ncbi:MAG: restriction endonuclease subunit S, partial [candidate division WOR-3 bacterium]|nr:restriction endonuclease subunit S [candidate division WOR-3 bacterium]
MTKYNKYPQNWTAIRLRALVRYYKGKLPYEIIEYQEENSLPYLSAEYLRNGIAEKFVKSFEDTIIVNDNDIVLLWDGSNAGEFFLGKRGVLSSTMVKIELNDNRVHHQFLFYSLKQKEKFLQNQTKGTGIPHVEKNVFENLQIPLPPLSEQKKIAEVLSTVDEAIAKVD